MWNGPQENICQIWKLCMTMILVIYLYNAYSDGTFDVWLHIGHQVVQFTLIILYHQMNQNKIEINGLVAILLLSFSIITFQMTQQSV